MSGFIHVKEPSSAAYPVLRVLLVQLAASAGCGSCFPAGFAGLPLLRARRVRGRCRLRCLPLQEWAGCSSTRSPYDRTPHPCQSLAPDRKLKEREFREIWAEFSTDQITSYSYLVTQGRSYRSHKRRHISSLETFTSCTFATLCHKQLNSKSLKILIKNADHLLIHRRLQTYLFDR